MKNSSQKPKDSKGHWTEEQEKAYWHEVNREYDEKETHSDEIEKTNAERLHHDSPTKDIKKSE